MVSREPEEEKALKAKFIIVESLSAFDDDCLQPRQSEPEISRADCTPG